MRSEEKLQILHCFFSAGLFSILRKVEEELVPALSRALSQPSLSAFQLKATHGGIDRRKEIYDINQDTQLHNS